jgi:hypothetical protein
MANDNIKSQIVGLVASLERFLADAEERSNMFFQNLLEKQHGRLKGLFERHVVSIHCFVVISVQLNVWSRRSKSRVWNRRN